MYVDGYSNHLYSIASVKSDILGADCGVDEDSRVTAALADYQGGFTFRTIKTTTVSVLDPILTFQLIKRQILYGSNPKLIEAAKKPDDYDLVRLAAPSDDYYVDDAMAQYPSGGVMRAELFQGKKGVHLPMPELIHQDHCYLKTTADYMQTAVDAFAIILEGNLDDVLRLPPSYVLRSARTIAMMKIAKEKLAATWIVVKGNRDPINITFEVLEMYRPLFKYLNGREMARLDLSDPKILTYIGTHADLDRHQVGVVASKYIKLNRRWTEPRYLNQMNNLLCGVPMTFMRKIPESTYLQLAHQVLGKAYSWSARDVSRLGLLLSEVEGTELAAVNPEAMSGITAQVMLEIPSHTLKHITEMQLRYIGQKPLNILAKKLKQYQDNVHPSGARRFLFDNSILLVAWICLIKDIL